ncbi:MAG: DUF86 domain-containing protein [Schwartzia sp.]|nr:DUF86 domain-containing protein [Schwartzia sp. (in: firmicutes)]MBR5163103.1 DUF86 domain-containing protein [Schwartzia sp. (in: firmicutes)]
MIADRDAQILQHIVNYCDQIDKTIGFWGKNEKLFGGNFIYQNAISMPLLSIGELANHLSKEFTDAHRKIPWREIVDMRNLFAHGYHTMEPQTIWDTAVSDVPQLNEFCRSVLEKENIPIPSAKEISEEG